MKLTQRAVEALTLPAHKSDLIVFDDGMPGFGFRLRRGAGGKLLRSWVVQYKKAGVSRRMLLGSAEVITAERARNMAKTALGQVAAGGDPQIDRQADRDKARHTLRSVVALFLEIKKHETRPRTFYEQQRYLAGDQYFKPLFGLAIDKISRMDVASRLTRIKLDSGPIVAGRARAQLSGLFAWAMTQGWCDINPVVGTEQPKNGKPRERVLSDIELGAIWAACADDDYGRIIHLLILTGCRRQEIGGLRWSELDFENGIWVLPAERSKNKTAHKLPLLPMMLDIIKAVPHIANRDQLFGERRAAGFSSWGRGKAALDARVSLPNWSQHDLRRTFATRCADLGVAPHIIEAVLNHQSGHRSGVAGIYNRSAYTIEVRNALLLWHDHVRSVVHGGKRKIIPMPRDAS